MDKIATRLTDWLEGAGNACSAFRFLALIFWLDFCLLLHNESSIKDLSTASFGADGIDLGECLTFAASVYVFFSIVSPIIQRIFGWIILNTHLEKIAWFPESNPDKFGTSEPYRGRRHEQNRRENFIESSRLRGFAVSSDNRTALSVYEGWVSSEQGEELAERLAFTFLLSASLDALLPESLCRQALEWMFMGPLVVRLFVFASLLSLVGATYYLGVVKGCGVRTNWGSTQIYLPNHGIEVPRSRLSLFDDEAVDGQGPVIGATTGRETSIPPDLP